ncbi:hypothetical protein Tco_0273823 [Tanacetum coccineum]
MSTSTHPIIILSYSEIEDVFSFINTLDYISASPDYSTASPGNTSSNPSEDLSKDLSASLTVSPFHDDLYMKVIQAYDATNSESPIPPPRALIAPQTSLPPSPRHEDRSMLFYHLDELPLERIEHMEDKIEGFLEPLYPGIMDMINNQDIEHMIPPTPPRDTEPPVGSPISLSPSSSVRSSSLVRSTTPPPDYPFDESIFAELDNSLWIIPRPLKSEPVLEKPNKSDAC